MMKRLRIWEMITLEMREERILTLLRKRTMKEERKINASARKRSRRHSRQLLHLCLHN